MRTRGVHAILGMGKYPSVVASSVVDQLMAWDWSRPLIAGEIVRFVGGLYSGIEAVFKAQDGDRVELEIVFMGKAVLIDAERSNIDRRAGF